MSAIKYNANLAGMVYRGLAGAAYYLAPPINGGTEYTTSTIATVILTGYYVEAGNTYLQTTNGLWISTYSSLYGNDLWDEAGQKVSVKKYSQADAQALVNRIIENNKHILQNNLLCSRFASKLTTAERSQLYDLQTRLVARNAALVENGLTTAYTTGTPAGYTELSPYLADFMTKGVGAVISTTTIIVAAVVVASLATAAYFAYHAYAAQSEDDVKFSDKLTKSLVSKLTEEEYQQLLSETKGIVTKARIKASLSSVSGLFKWALIGTAAYLVYTHITKGGNYETQKKH